jgi:hypothetical protein
VTWLGEIAERECARSRAAVEIGVDMTDLKLEGQGRKRTRPGAQVSQRKNDTRCLKGTGP